MRRWTLNRRERRVLVVGGTLIAGMFGFSRGVPAWSQWRRDARASAAEMTAEVARAEASVARLESTLDSLEARKSRLVQLAPRFVGIESPSAAASALATLVSGTAQASGVRVSSIQVGHDTTPGLVVRRVWVNAELEGDIRGVASLLSALERGPTLLAIREMSISQPDPAAHADLPESLGVRLRVEGLAIDRDAAEDRP